MRVRLPLARPWKRMRDGSRHRLEPGWLDNGWGSTPPSSAKAGEPGGARGRLEAGTVGALTSAGDRDLRLPSMKFAGDRDLC